MIRRFCAILIGIALTWSCAAAGLFLLDDFCTIKCSKQRIARQKAREIVSMLWQFEIENQRCPTGNLELIENGDISAHTLVDPWGTVMAFGCSDDGPRARSAGPDRKFGTADDVTDAY